MCTNAYGEWARRIARATIALGAALTTASGATAQSSSGAARLPFFVGERLEYRVRAGRVGAVGRTTMVVDTPQVLRGTTAWVLRFDFHAKVGPIGAVDHTESWLDPERLTSLRFHKHERHPLSKHDERVELYPETHRWAAEDGASGTIASEAPLDELSFMYVLRTLSLTDTGVTYARHFDAARNPTRVRVLGRRSVTTEAGTFRTVLVEMRVQDPRRFRGEGVILLDLTDDHCRIPVRIESTMPVIGKTTMTLEAQNHPAEHHLAQLP
ncbi:Protein of unknown function DUF3108 (plasmid) [Gemmatirosa kalamazoonensis]|uniref:DUF3108 domain-containing protein n=1 Tax=Gemmatirosa kalamazoonensis TaxID=861299 RepID=W0RQ12_9BACT|nr:DUF3108 domain-containing protein [Gemmatirosa kalamazoonensis]AHG92572.1 Protein of unknown function DUF3108 [Gemmatirosa kalamazoonensis]